MRIMVHPVSEYQDIQGLLRSGYGSLTEAVFLLLRIANSSEAKAWLGAVAGASGAEKLAYRVTRAADLDLRQVRALQVAFTAPGIRTLGAPEDLFRDDSLHAFPHEFRLGMAGYGLDTEARSRRLGDIGKSAPSNWEWGAARTQTPDVLVMLYAETGGLEAFLRMVLADLASGFEVYRMLDTANTIGEGKLRREPFGFVDGISQPEIDWLVRRKPGTSADLEYGNLIAPGEFLLGYQNEYGLYTRRPLLEPVLDPANILSPADDNPVMHDLGRNGTYLVFRQLEQDVGEFWRFVRHKSPEDRGVTLAEAMVGRKLANGDPLITATRAEIAGIGPNPLDIRQNNFTFEPDPEGLTCPFGAHIRRANPRTADLPGGREGIIPWLLRTLGLQQGGPRDDLLSSSRFHRIIRRGRPYGVLTGDPQGAARGGSPDIPTGLHFICLNANISRQFEFIQSAWISNAQFNAMSLETDPLLGNRVPSPTGQATDTFSLPDPAGPSRRIAGLPQFVTVRGGGYFFLPSIRALRFFAQ